MRKCGSLLQFRVPHMYSELFNRPIHYRRQTVSTDMSLYNAVQRTPLERSPARKRARRNDVRLESASRARVGNPRNNTPQAYQQKTKLETGKVARKLMNREMLSKPLQENGRRPACVTGRSRPPKKKCGPRMSQTPTPKKRGPWMSQLRATNP